MRSGDETPSPSWKKRSGIDKTGPGLTQCEWLARKHGEDRIKGCNFSAKYAVAMVDR